MTGTDSNALLIARFDAQADFARVFFDGYVLVDHNCKIIRSNKFFSRLTGVPANLLLLAESLDEIIRLELGGESVNLKDIIRQAKPTRIDELRGITGKMENHVLTLSIYPFWDNEEFLGSFLMIRDVSSDHELQSRYRVKSVLSVTDALTGIYNRAYFEQYLPAQFNRDRDIPGHRDERKMSLIMIDIDHFKKTNDTFGHLAGDLVIKEVAQILKSQARASDIICRYGGEEFLAILVDTDVSGACVAAEKFRNAVANHKFLFEGREIPTTISLGLTAINFSVDKMATAMSRADEALYTSKRSGRNQTQFHDSTTIQKFSGKQELRKIS